MFCYIEEKTNWVIIYRFFKLKASLVNECVCSKTISYGDEHIQPQQQSQINVNLKYQHYFHVFKLIYGIVSLHFIAIYIYLHVVCIYRNLYPRLCVYSSYTPSHYVSLSLSLVLPVNDLAHRAACCDVQSTSRASIIAFTQQLHTYSYCKYFTKKHTHSHQIVVQFQWRRVFWFIDCCELTWK